VEPTGTEAPYREWAAHFNELMAENGIREDDLCTGKNHPISRRWLTEVLLGRHYPSRAMRRALANALNVSVTKLEGTLSWAAQPQTSGPTPTAPAVSVIKAHTNDSALRAICDRVLRAQVVLNTKVTISDSTFASTNAPASLKRWEDAVRRAIATRPVFFKEVVSPGYVTAVRLRVEALKSPKGNYEAKKITCDLAAFLNFTVFQFPNSPKQVFFGWLLSKTYGFEHVCYESEEPNLVSLFENWFYELWESGQLLHPPGNGAG